MKDKLDRDYDHIISTKKEYFNIENISILILEDENANKLFLDNLLGELINKLDFVNKGVEVLQLLKKNSNYDLVIMNLDNLSLEGIKTSKDLRDNNIFIPIIGITNSVSESEKVNYLKSGINDFLLVPFVSEKIVPIIFTWIKKSRLNKELFDFDQIISIFGNNMSIIINIAGSFFDNNKNFSTIQLDKEFVHKLKGSSGTMGFKRLMEISIKLHNNPESEKYKNELIDCFEITKKAFYELFIKKEIET